MILEETKREDDQMNYIETKEIAKQVRRDLKALYPSVKFSVTSKFNSISVSWTDGVTTDVVEEIVSKYSGKSGWDSNYGDYAENKPVEFRGELVSTHLDYIHTDRSYSKEYLDEVLEYVKGCYGNAENDGVAVESTDSNNAYFNGNDIDEVYKYAKLARKYNSFLSIKNQVEADKQQEEFEKLERIEKAEFEAQQLEEALETVVIEPESITAVEPFVVEGTFANINKNNTLEEYQIQILKGEFYTELCKVSEWIDLSTVNYDCFTNSLMADYPWVAGKGGCGRTTINGKEVECTISVVVSAPNRETILVDPQGHSYARYVALVPQSINLHKPVNKVNRYDFAPKVEEAIPAIAGVFSYQVITDAPVIEPIIIQSKRKGLRVDVLRSDNYECTKRGVSARYSSLILVGEGIPEVSEESEDVPVVELKTRNVYGTDYYYCKPVDIGGKHSMMGGNFCWSSDNRFPIQYPLPIHDRVEG
jgi:hypothetical protein